MATSLLLSTPPLSKTKTNFKTSTFHINKSHHFTPKQQLTTTTLITTKAAVSSSSSFYNNINIPEDDELNNNNVVLQPPNVGPVKFALWVLFWASLSLAFFAASSPSSSEAKAVAAAASSSVDSIKASSFGLKVASALRSFGWADQAVVFSLATLPVIELRGAIPVGYWMQLNPFALTVLSVLGNMLPVPFILLYLKKFASFVAGMNQTMSRFIDMLFQRGKEKAGPIEEFQWLGLMLFVAVPFPGTGAWTGAIIASLLDMPFLSSLTANLFGVILAGLLVNLLVNLGLKYAIVTGIILFIISTFMWSILRNLRRSLGSSNA